MEKTFFFVAFFFAAILMQAQRCVVLDFQIGDNVTAEEVDAVSYEFRSNFIPSCYIVEDFLRLKRILKELGLNPTNMKKEQIRKLGRDMVATIVVYGSLSKYMGEYTLDVSVMDISTGTTLAGQNSVFQQTEYRTKAPSVAQGMAAKLCGASSGSSSSNTSFTAPKTSQKPVPAGYTDLGLPSGKIWKNINATGFYTYDEAVSQFGSRLPTKEDWEELKAECQWSWTGSGYKVTGPNGNSISLPAAGVRRCNGSVYYVGSDGLYWSSTPNGSDKIWYLYFSSGRVNMRSILRCYGLSVRLVQD